MRPKPWTETETQFLRDFYASDGAAFVAHRLNRSLSAVQTKASRLYMATGNARPWTETEDATLAGRYPNGGTRSCSKHLQRSVTGIKRRAQKLGVRRAI